MCVFVYSNIKKELRLPTCTRIGDSFLHLDYIAHLLEL